MSTHLASLDEIASDLAESTLQPESSSAYTSRETLSEAQTSWAERSIGDRLLVLKRARSLLAADAQSLADAISPDLARTKADTLVAEVLPLLAACKFLEQNAERILHSRRLGRRGLPFWLSGVHSEIRRVPLGTVLVIGPSNYPLFLPGVQALQGLAAGNAMIWKPGRGGCAVAQRLAAALYAAGLPQALLRVTGESAEAAELEIERGIDKVFLTGSVVTGRKLLRRLADTLTPCVAELSGCDAMVVLPSADLSRVAAALAFGMRLNGSATCMAPRRVLMMDADDERRSKFLHTLLTVLNDLQPISLQQSTRVQLLSLLTEARSNGATIHGDVGAEGIKPVVVCDVTASMSIAQADIFAPLLMIMDIKGEDGVLAAQQACPFGLTASIFGSEREARALGDRLTVGIVVINDVIVPTADPRVPFGGRKQSGFGATRGPEGLLEMTAAKVISVRGGASTRHYEPVSKAHEGIFNGMIVAAHAGSLRERLNGLRQIVQAGRRLKEKE